MSTISKVEVQFSAHASRFDAVPGDRKKVDEALVPGLVADGVAAPVSVKEAEKAGVSPQEAVTKK